MLPRPTKPSSDSRSLDRDATASGRFRSRRRLRVTLLGAVGAVALAGALVNLQIGPFDAAQAATPSTLTTTAPVAATPAPQSIAPMSFADVVERVKGAVVSVKVKTMEASTSADEEDAEGNPDMPQLSPDNPLEKFFHQFGEGQGRNHFPEKHPHVGMAQGSGFFITDSGYVVTNNHVVENATIVTITTSDGKTYPAKVVGLDKKTDLALLKVEGSKPFPFVTFAPTQPRVGDWVLAVGNPFGLGGTVTAGIVSARGRDIGAGPYDDFLQIDAPVNRGNSGGPTFNAAGQVVGVNTAIYSPSGGSVGIGFAIASDVVKNVVTSLEKTGSVQRGWIGVQIQPVTDDIADSMNLKGTRGALVAEAQKNSPALDAGIQSGDVITAVDGDMVDGPRELARKIAGLGPGAKADITYLRDGQPHNVTITLGRLPGDKQEAPKPVEQHVSSMEAFGLRLAPAQSVAGAGKVGVVVTDIDPDGIGAQHGLRSGDVIIEAAGKPVATAADVVGAMDAAKKEGRKAVLLRVKSEQGVHYVALEMQKAS